MFNAIGALLWTDSVLLAGYVVARTLWANVNSSSVDNFILPLIALIIVVSLIPVMVEVVKARRRSTAAPAGDR